MSEEKKEQKESFKFLKNWSFLTKLKQVKHIGLIVTVIFILILLIILFGNFDFLRISTSSINASQTASSTYISSSEYVGNMEQKLKTIISKIKGAGKVDVMVTLESGTNLLLASNDETKTVKSGSDSTTTVSVNPIILEQSGDGAPIVIGEVLPKIKGVVVVSSGAGNIAVRMNILNAVQTLLDLNDTQIQILVGE